MKRFLILILAVVMCMTLIPATPSYAAIQNNPDGIQLPDGFSLQYIGRYHEASPVIDGMIAVSNGKDRIWDRPVWGFVDAETGKEIIDIELQYNYYDELHDGFNDDVRYPRYFGNTVLMRNMESAVVFNRQGDVVVPYGKYAYISVFMNGYAEVRTDDGKWGIINSEGKEMFPLGKYAPFEKLHWWGPSGVIPVIRIDNNLLTVIDVFGKELITPSNTIAFNHSFNGFTLIFDEEARERYVIDSTGKKLFTHEWHRVLFPFAEGLSFFVQFKPNSLVGNPDAILYEGFVDTLGNEVYRLPKGYHIDYLMRSWYTNGLIKAVSVNNEKNAVRSGCDSLFDLTGKEIFKTQGFISEVGNGLAQVLMPVFESGEYITDIEMLYNLTTGKNILPKGYKLTGYPGDSSKSLGREVGVDYQHGLEFPDALIGIIEATDYRSSTLDFDSFMTQLKRAYINVNGDIVVPPGKYSEIKPFTHGKGRVRDYNSKWGFIDSKGDEIIKTQFDEATYFVEGKALVGIHTDVEVDWAKYHNSWYAAVGQELPSYMTDWYILTDDNYKSETQSTVKPNKPETLAVEAKPTSSKVLVNGSPLEFDAYTINNNNYFKLRDLAQAVNNTDKNFEVTWDGKNNAINLISNKPYTPAGGELVKGDGKAKAATLSTAKIYKDGKEIALTAYTINGNNYFKLRDIAKAFDIGVAWDSKTNTVGIDTSISYVEE